MNKIKKYLIILPMVLLVTACGADVDGMSKALQRANGWSANSAACYAEELSTIMDAEHYDYMAKLMGKGADMKTAMNKVRRKFGSSYSSKISNHKPLNICVE